ncbi:MAG: dihydrolipoamide acetyltransferase family protein [Ktedonobacteraceae bacterium]
MEKSLTMPKLGMTMTEGTILKWYYQEGDYVEKDEVLLEVMTDKVNIEVEAPFSAYLTKILAREDATLPVGEPMAILTDDKAEPASTTPAPKATQPASTAPAPKATQLVYATTAIASTPAAKREAVLQGIDLRSIAQAGTQLPLQRDDVLAFVQKNSTGTLVQEPEQQAQITTPPESVRATPVAQKIAREHQLDLTQLAVLKPGGKLTRSDVEAHISARPPLQDKIPEPAQASSAESELLPLSPVRQLIGQRMLNSFSSIPHIYLDTEVDMGEAERCRQRVGQSLQQRGEKAPSLTAVLLRALAATLLLHPQVNAAFEAGGLHGKDALRQWNVVHIGIAVDTGQALLTPVLRNAHLQSLPTLSNELRRLTRAAHEGKLKPEDMAGATFTVSNLGMYGIDTFHAIIPPGQGAIIAVGKVTKRSVVIEDEQGERLEIRPMMKLSLSVDHRILDGAAGSRFLQQLKAFLEDPYLLL